ncbi:MAG: 5'-nucleotidase C-terminal domain-containing protein [Chloroflexota bacterium]
MLRKSSLWLCMLLVIGLFASVVYAQDDTFKLTIMHTNDEHSWHAPQSNGNGGAALLASVVKQIRAEGGNTLLLDAGDRFTGTLFHSVHKGQDSVQIMNMLGYDAMTLGNHEFDGNKDNPEILESFVAGLKFPVVSANITFPAASPLAQAVKPYTVLDVNGQKVGVIGLTTPEAEILSTPGKDIVFHDNLAEITNKAVEDLTAQGVNKIILLTHIGIDAAMELAPQLHGVDVFVDGHSHTLLSNANAGAAGKYPILVADADGKNIQYVQAGEKSIYLGRLDVTFDADGNVTAAAGDTILLSRYITPDADMQTLVTTLQEPVKALEEQPINATTDVVLVGEREVCRIEECNMGDVIADAMRAETGAQIAIMNGGGIRSSIEAGDITLGEVLQVQPFGNTIATFKAKGVDIVAALENGVSLIKVDAGKVVRAGGAGRFPQVSGLTFSFDPNLEPGNRIQSVQVMGADGKFSDIDLEATYSVVTNNFVRQGGDGYTMFNDNAIDPYDFGRVDYEALRDYLAANSPIKTETDGRVTIVNAEVEPLP